MLIRSYECTRFAGLKDIKLDFEEGLNIILGENESGKSTLIEGIHSTLFKNIKLRGNNNADKDFSFRFMPKPKGDFIDGRLVLETTRGKYEIAKEWGSGESIELVTPDGSIMKNEDDIHKELTSLLSYGEGTYSNIVFAKQRELKKALSNIISNNEVTKEIGDLLRMALMELDGVSIDGIQKNIEAEIEELYKRWDRDKNYPQNNKGINNPYKTGLGIILKSYYDMENLRRDMELADKREKEFENICKEISDLRNNRENLSREKVQLEKIESDVNDRSILNAEIRAINKELEDLLRANREWPMTQQLLGQLDEKILDLKDKKMKLEEEKINIGKLKRKEELEKKIKKLKGIQEKLKLVLDDISKIPAITKEDIDRLSDLQRELLTLETTMEAGKMIAVLKKSKEKVYIRKSFGEVEVMDLDTRFEANGLINISYGDDFELEVKTGELDFEDLNLKYNSLKKEEKDLFKDLNIDSIEMGRLNFENIKSKKNEKLNFIRELELVLDNRTMEEIEKELEDLVHVRVFKGLEDIDKELSQINEEEIDMASEKKSKSTDLRSWEEKYINHDNLLELLLEEKANLSLNEGKLKNLRPLPDEFETVEEFKERLRYLRDRLEEIDSLLNNLNADYYEAKNNLLEDTFEELKKAYLDSEKAYERNINRGKKFLEIQRVFMETKDRLSNNPMDSLVKEFSRLLGMITSGDYKTGNIDEDFNILLENPNGEIPIELLSAGTYDSVSLALRFSLLKHIFKDKGGYVVLDDCLVDLDPVRRDQAIGLINDFAKDYQIIFTTCNPHTAKLLGGRIIEL